MAESGIPKDDHPEDDGLAHGSGNDDDDGHGLLRTTKSIAKIGFSLGKITIEMTEKTVKFVAKRIVN